jgi:hypothetical protein
MAAFVRFGRAARQNTGFARVARAATSAGSFGMPQSCANPRGGGAVKPAKALRPIACVAAKDSSSFNRAPQEH